jgi:ubiquinone/menaquinone biosynthesis C-methylase UbiE
MALDARETSSATAQVAVAVGPLVRLGVAKRQLGALVLLAYPLTACSGTRVEEPPPPPVERESVKPGINDDFLGEDVDVRHFAGVFESESREIAACKDEIAATLGLEPGMAVADVGSGTGLYLELLASGVGESGKVYALDIAPAFVALLEKRVRHEGWEQVEVRLCTERSVELPPESLDVAFVCDTYHHFEYPRSTLWSLARALRPGGRLVVVDFERIPGVSREWVLDHVRADKATFRSEIEAAGFVFEDEVEIAGLAENYVLRFRRP